MIDAHHHLWRYSEQEYGWIDDSMGALKRDFLLQDLERETRHSGVTGTVVVQARECEEETHWLLGMARRSSLLCGVVGWLDLQSPQFAQRLEMFSQGPRLVGLRHIVQAEPKGFLTSPAFNRGVHALQGSGLVYDLLIRESQLEEAIHFVDRYPEQRFVLDHVAKPRIAQGELEPWRSRMVELGRRPNVWCKVSGMVTEANWRAWSAEQLRPYLDAVVEAFGPMRLMAGSDWPVCLLASSYEQWWRILLEYFAAFSRQERASVFQNCAVGVYGLKLGTAGGQDDSEMRIAEEKA